MQGRVFIHHIGRLVATVPEPRGFTRAQARQADSDQSGDIVTFCESEKGTRVPARATASMRSTPRPAPSASPPTRAATTTGRRPLACRPSRGLHGDRAQVPRLGPASVHPRQLPRRPPQRANRRGGRSCHSAGSSMVVARDDGRRDILARTRAASYRPGTVSFSARSFLQGRVRRHATSQHRLPRWVCRRQGRHRPPARPRRSGAHLVPGDGSAANADACTAVK